MEAKKCLNCKFWQQRAEDDGVETVEKRYGLCRRYAPTARTWVPTQARDWCGDYVHILAVQA